MVQLFDRNANLAPPIGVLVHGAGKVGLLDRAERIVDLSVEAAWDVGDLTFFTFDDPATPGCTYYGTVVPTACGPCPAGGDDTCVPVTLEAMVADVDGALALSYVGPDDIAGDPDCGALP